MTKDIRKGQDTLLLSFVKPHNAVHVDTIRRWIMFLMKLAGINTDVFKAHSTRSASSSKAMTKQVPISQILKSGTWSKDSTFAKFYKKDIDMNETSTVKDFQKAVYDVGK